MRGGRACGAALLALSLWLPSAAARADAVGLLPGPSREPVDPTRRDVARLPPEAAPRSRDLHARGAFAEAMLGARTFVGDARRVSRAGPRLAVAVGYEPTRWLSLFVELDGSLHDTRGRPPPARTSFELLSAALGVRLTAPLDARVAIWAAGLAGIAWSSGDVLRALGFQNAVGVGPSYGGDLGIEWHMASRHHALGLLGGARLYPRLAEGGHSVGTHGSAYLRYVF